MPNQTATVPDPTAEPSSRGQQARSSFLAATLPLFLSLATVILCLALTVEAKTPYFELVAQIIPVMVLALVIEQRYFFQDQPPEMPTLFAMWPFRPEGEFLRRPMAIAIYGFQAVTLVILVGGEVAALWATATSDPSSVEFALATGSLVGGATALVVSSEVKGVRARRQDVAAQE